MTLSYRSIEIQSCRKKTVNDYTTRSDAGMPLIQQQRHLQDIIDSLGDELMVVDRDMRITLANSAVKHSHGDSRAKTIGRHCYEVSHGLQKPCSSPECECPVQRVFESGKPERVTHVHIVSNGSEYEERYVEIIASPVRDDQGNIVEVVELMRDITEARKLEKQLVEANKNLRALNTVASAVSQSIDLDTVLETALDKVIDVMGLDLGAIMLLDSDTQSLSHRVHRGLSEEFVNGVGELKVGEGIAGKVAQLREPAYFDDLSQAPGVARRSLVRKEHHRAFCSVPLLSKDKVLGVMNIGSHGVRHFEQKDIELLTSIANQIAVVIDNAQLYSEIQRKEEMRGELLRLIISTQEEERKRIARELHDETSQSLTGLAVNIEAVVNALPLHPRQLEDKLRRMQSIALDALDGIHRAIYELRPSLLDDLGLVSAIHWHSDNSLKEAGIEAHVGVEGVERRLPIQIETALFRIVQEATTNIIRHAGASSVDITIKFNKAILNIFY